MERPNLTISGKKMPKATIINPYVYQTFNDSAAIAVNKKGVSMITTIG
jgi:hypothetical protein